MNYAVLWSKPVRFLAIGGVMMVSGLALNVLLVEVLHTSHRPAYAVVMVFLVFLGFILNRFVTFDKGDTRLLIRFFRYTCAVILFRLVDWLLYTFLVEGVTLYYPAAQVVSGSIVLVAKYFSYKKLFEQKGSDTG